MGGTGGVGVLISGNGSTQSTITNQLGDFIGGGRRRRRRVRARRMARRRRRSGLQRRDRDDVGDLGAITGSGSVTINNTAGNTGTIEFTNTGNAYTGTTTVEAGELLGGVAGAFSAASATTVNSGAILDLGGFAQTINSVTLTGGTIQNGSLTGAISSAGGTVNGIGGSTSLEATASATPTMMEGSNTCTGATTVDTGATLSGADGTNVFSAASPTTVNGTLDLGGNSQTVGSLAGTGIVANSGASGTATLTNQGASSEFDGVIQDGATAVTALTQNAPGNTLTLTGTNTYTGATTIAAGALALSGSGSIANSSGVSLATGGVFDISQTTAGASIQSLGQHRRRPDGDRLPRRAKSLTLTGALTTFGGVIADAADQQRGRRRADAKPQRPARKR